MLGQGQSPQDKIISTEDTLFFITNAENENGPFQSLELHPKKDN